MRDISAAVGLQIKALYYHFKDKQALLAFLLDRNFVRLFSELGELKQPDSPADRLVQFSQCHIPYHTNDRLDALLAT